MTHRWERQRPVVACCVSVLGLGGALAGGCQSNALTIVGGDAGDAGEHAPGPPSVSGNPDAGTSGNASDRGNEPASGAAGAVGGAGAGGESGEAGMSAGGVSGAGGAPGGSAGVGAAGASGAGGGGSGGAATLPVCVARLANGSACTSSHSCASKYCDAGTHVCADAPLCGGVTCVCAEGSVCTLATLLSICSSFGMPYECDVSPASLGYTCNAPVQCGYDLSCTPGNAFPSCQGQIQQLGQKCQTTESSPNTNTCALGLYCSSTPPAGVCEWSACGSCVPAPGPGDTCPAHDKAGVAVDCRADSYCGTTAHCQLRAALGANCSTDQCLTNLRCTGAGGGV